MRKKVAECVVFKADGKQKSASINLANPKEKEEVKAAALPLFSRINDGDFFGQSHKTFDLKKIINKCVSFFPLFKNTKRKDNLLQKQQNFDVFFVSPLLPMFLKRGRIKDTHRKPEVNLCSNERELFLQASESIDQTERNDLPKKNNRLLLFFTLKKE